MLCITWLSNLRKGDSASRVMRCWIQLELLIVTATLKTACNGLLNSTETSHPMSGFLRQPKIQSNTPWCGKCMYVCTISITNINAVQNVSKNRYTAYY